MKVFPQHHYHHTSYTPDLPVTACSGVCVFHEDTAHPSRDSGTIRIKFRIV